MKISFVSKKGILGIPWLVYSLGCFAIAMVYYFVWPEHVEVGSDLGYFFVRYGHTLVWVCLGIACFLRKLGLSNIVKFFLYLSLLLYIGFLFFSYIL